MLIIYNKYLKIMSQQLVTVSSCTTDTSVTGYCTSCNPPTGCTQGF